jgi:ribose 1,5-bisphosphokinase
VADNGSFDQQIAPGNLPLGPGRVTLVVGPSGAGKDAILQYVRERLAQDQRFVFPRRIVTRAVSAAEDHDVMSPDAFEARRQSGGFALHWQAHGLSYGISSQMDDTVRRGITVVFNASRQVVAEAKSRYVCFRRADRRAAAHKG